MDYKNKDFDAAQIEPGWHAWMSYAVDKAPTQDPLLAYKRRPWEDRDAATIPNHTLTWGAYKPYNTYVPPRFVWGLPLTQAAGLSRSTPRGSPSQRPDDKQSEGRACTYHPRLLVSMRMHTRRVLDSLKCGRHRLCPHSRRMVLSSWSGDGRNVGGYQELHVASAR